MVDEGQVSGWILLFIGLYAFAAGIGELRRPGTWRRMLIEMEASPTLAFFGGFAALLFGALTYLFNPWNPGDWLSILVTVIAGIAVLEGMLILAVGGWYLRLARRMISGGSFIWALFSMVAGLCAVAAGVIRV